MLSTETFTAAPTRGATRVAPSAASTSNEQSSTGPVLAGQMIGNWQFTRRLGAGQWSCVYQARPLNSDPHSPADYAIKIVRPDCEQPDLGGRLLKREAAVSQIVTHPNLTSILAAHVKKPPYYLVMPCLDAVSAKAALSHAAQQGIRGLPAPHAVWIARQAAQALHALHQQGWLHADVKPENLLVNTSGHVTLIDLGLARNFRDRQSAAEVITGTMAYAAPEFYVPSLPSGPASDVYSLGIVLYELLTGELPFTERDPTELAAAHLQRRPPDPRRVKPQLPLRVTRLLQRMLAKQAERRPAILELVPWLVELEIDTFHQRVVA